MAGPSKNKLNSSQVETLEPRLMLMKSTNFPVRGVDSNQNAKLSVDLDSSRESNDRLFGVNLGWKVGPVRNASSRAASVDYDSSEVQDFVRRWNPPEIRWGDGLFANYYDYQTDTRSRRGVLDSDPRLGDLVRVDEETGKPILDDEGNERPVGGRYGREGFADLQNELGFDTIYTWNINQDGPARGVSRLRNLRERGVNVDRIELGNELFFADQRAGNTQIQGKERQEIERRARNATPGDSRAKSRAARDAVDEEESQLIVEEQRKHYDALKAENPDLQISIPVTYRFTGDDVRQRSVIYNDATKANQDFYDAVSLHRYVRNNENRPTSGPEITNRDVLDARNTILDTAQDVRDVYEDKDIWLTEFAVRGNDLGEGGDNALSALALADTYLGLIDNPDLIASANYFQGNSGTPLINYASGENGKLDATRTTLGATYDSLRNVFTGGSVLESSVDSTDLDEGLDAISAEVAEKDGEVLVYAVNKSPFPADFDLEFDGQAFDGDYEFQTIQFDNIDDSLDLADQSEAARLNLDNREVFGNAQKRSGSTVRLPGLSMSLISIDRALV